MKYRTADRYLAKATIGGVILALILLLAVDAFFALLGELGDVGKGRYSVEHALWYVLLTLPRRAYDLFPTAAVVGALMGVGGLAASSELIALRAAGMSKIRIATSVVMAAGIVLIGILWLGEWVAPRTERMAQAIRIGAQTDDLALDDAEALWVRDGDRFVTARRAVQLTGRVGVVKLADVEIYQFVDDRLAQVTRAETGHHDGEHWILEKVARSNLDPGGVSVEYADEERWDSLIDPELLSAAVVRPRGLSLMQLVPYVAYLERNELDAAPYRSALWWHVAYPFAALVVVLAATPFLFGSLRSGSLGQRLFMGMLLGIGFYLVNRTAVSMGQVYGFSPALSAFAPSLLLLGGATWLLRRSA